MKRLAMLVFAAAYPLFAAPVPKELKQNETLQGTWKVESIIIFGQPSSENLYWSIDADGKLDRHSDPVAPADAVRSIVLKQDRAAKSLDFCTGNLTYLGTYRLRGDILEFCLAKQGEARPIAIEATPATYLWSLKQVKPEEKK